MVTRRHALRSHCAQRCFRSSRNGLPIDFEESPVKATLEWRSVSVARASARAQKNFRFPTTRLVHWPVTLKLFLHLVHSLTHIILTSMIVFFAPIAGRDISGPV